MRTVRPALIGRTHAVCPVCLRRLRADRVRREDGVRLERRCPEHGPFSTLVWRDRVDFREWTRGAVRDGRTGEGDCPHGCGLCEYHLRGTCCVLLEVTSRCDLGSCRFCFADREDAPRDPDFAEIERRLRALVRPGGTLLQLSGGEPAVRDDLPRIVRAAREAGCEYVQLNTNGLRLAEEPSFAAALADAGLSFVFLQFDGTDDAVYRRLRGRPLLDVKERAIAHCAAQGLGVTLVPTLVRGVNTDGLGEILRFAVSRAPGVRGVHFQPACYLGRIPGLPANADRYTLDELIADLGDQAADPLAGAPLLPSCCDHPLCGFHADFIVLENGRLYPLRREGGGASCCGGDPAKRNREFVGRRWQRPVSAPETTCGGGDIGDMAYFAARARSHAFTVTAMAFQDAGSLDLERLRSCSLHVYRDGAFVPFCAHYLTSQDR